MDADSERFLYFSAAGAADSGLFSKSARQKRTVFLIAFAFILGACSSDERPAPEIKEGARRALLEERAALQAKAANLAQAEAKLGEEKREFQEQRAELTQAEEKLNKARRVFQEQRAALAQAEAGFLGEKGRALQEQSRSLEEKEQALQAARRETEALRAQVTAGESALQAKEAELAARREEIESRKNSLNNLKEMIENRMSALREERKALKEEREKLKTEKEAEEKEAGEEKAGKESPLPPPEPESSEPPLGAGGDWIIRLNFDTIEREYVFAVRTAAGVDAKAGADPIQADKVAEARPVADRSVAGRQRTRAQNPAGADRISADRISAESDGAVAAYLKQAGPVPATAAPATGRASAPADEKTVFLKNKGDCLAVSSRRFSGLELVVVETSPPMNFPTLYTVLCSHKWDEREFCRPGHYSIEKQEEGGYVLKPVSSPLNFDEISACFSI